MLDLWRGGKFFWYFGNRRDFTDTYRETHFDIIIKNTIKEFKGEKLKYNIIVAPII